MNPETIKAIGELWLLALIICLTVLACIFRRQLKALIDGIALTKLHIKRGNTEFQSEFTQKPILEKPSGNEIAQIEHQATAPLPPPKTDGQAEMLHTASITLSTGSVEAKEDNTSDTIEYWVNICAHAVFSREFAKSEEYLKKWQELIPNPNDKLIAEATYFSWRSRNGDPNALQKLQELTKHKPLGARVFNLIGDIHERAGNYTNALLNYENAIQNALSDQGRITNIIAAARCNYFLNNKELALTSIQQELKNPSNIEFRTLLYTGLASLYALDNNHELQALALEKAIEVNPNDIEVIFGAAYAYSEYGNHALAVLQYNNLLELNPDHEWGLNNIGNSYNKLSLPLLGAKFLKNAHQVGNTLAAANIAFKYIEIGFEEEALEILNQAKQKDAYHSSVDSAISHLYSLKADEERKYKKIFEDASAQRKFSLSYADAYFIETSDRKSFSGIWRFPDGEKISIQEQAGKLITIESTDSIATQVTIHGTIHNQAASLRTNFLTKTSWNNNSGRAFLSTDGNQISVMLETEQTPVFLTLNRIADQQV